jgi:Tol biopolymer transport system component
MRSNPQSSCVRCALGLGISTLWVTFSVSSATAAYPGKNGLIAFADSTEGAIYTMEPDGTGVSLLVSGGGLNWLPSFSPDGEWVAFTRQTNDGGAIWMIHRQGFGLERLTDGPSHWQPTWSPDGNKIAFQCMSTEGDEDAELCLFDFATYEVTMITSPTDNAFVGAPSWCADDERIVFEVSHGDDGNYDIGSVAPGGGEISLITDDDVIDFNPDCSPDGTQIVYERRAETGTTVNVTESEPGAGAGSPIASSTAFAPRWSPDGTRIVHEKVSETGPGGSEIWTMKADGSDATALTELGRYSIQPNWQPIVDVHRLELRFVPKSVDSFGLDRFEVSSDGFHKRSAVVTVKNGDDEPVEGQTVLLEPNVLVDPRNTAAARMVVCAPEGERLWPGRIGPSLDFLHKVERKTDAQGIAEVTVYAGTQSGTEWLLEAREKAPRDANDGRFLRLRGTGQATVDGFALFDEIEDQLDVVRRFLPSPRGTTAEKQESLLQWLAMLRFTAFEDPLFAQRLRQVEFAPIHAVAGADRHAGIVFYPRGSSPNPLLHYMEDEASPGDPATYYVLDVADIEGSPVDNYQPRLVIDGVGLPTLAQWESTIGARARPGRLEPQADEDLVHFGYPYPPPGGIAAAAALRAAYGRCLHVPALSATVASPVNLVFTDEEGGRIGADAQGNLIFEAPGVIVVGTGANPGGYVVPRGDYTVSMAGTATGDAVVAFHNPAEDPDDVTVYVLAVTAGAGGQLAIDDGTASKSLVFGGTQYTAQGGLPMTVRYVFKSLRSGEPWARRLRVWVKDPYGGKLRGARVELDYDEIHYERLTNRRGKTRMKIRLPTPGQVDLTISAATFVTFSTQLVVD